MIHFLIKVLKQLFFFWEPATATKNSPPTVAVGLKRTMDDDDKNDKEAIRLRTIRLNKVFEAEQRMKHAIQQLHSLDTRTKILEGRKAYKLRCADQRMKKAVEQLKKLDTTQEILRRRRGEKKAFWRRFLPVKHQ